MPQVSILAGRPIAQLQADLAKAQQAYIDLSAGAKGVNFSYGSGDGVKTVAYTAATIGQLTALIRQLQAELGLICRTRRPFRPIYL